MKQDITSAEFIVWRASELFEEIVFSKKKMNKKIIYLIYYFKRTIFLNWEY